MLEEVTDLELLQKLNGGDQGLQEVTDPEILKMLNSGKGFYVAPDQSSTEMVETFAGQMPKEGYPQFKPGTPEFEKQIHSLVDIAAGAPGMQMIGKVASPGVLSGIAGSGKELAQKAFRKVFPSAKTAEEALAQASKEAEIATAEATPVKPGLFDAPTTELESIENEIGKHINVEAPHGVEISKGISNRVEDIENYWKSAYKNLMDKVKESKIVMPELASKMLPSGVKISPKKGVNEFSDWLAEFAPTQVDTSVDVVLAKYKDYRNALDALKEGLKDPNYTAVQKLAIGKAIPRGETTLSQIKSALNKGLGKYKDEFQRVNKGYSKEVYPLRENPVVRKARQGKLGEDVIRDMRTNETGMELVRNIVKQDPELLRNIVGQKYLKKPAAVHSPNQLVRDYLNEMPEFKNLLIKKEKALKKHAARKDISLEEKIKAEKELERVTKKREKIKKYATRGGLVGAGYIAAKIQDNL